MCSGADDRPWQQVNARGTSGPTRESAQSHQRKLDRGADDAVCRWGTRENIAPLSASSSQYSLLCRGRRAIPLRDLGALVSLGNYNAFGSLGRFGFFKGGYIKGRLGQPSHATDPDRPN
jgi:hypothetical protein